MKTGSKVMLLGKKFDPAQVGWSASMRNIYYALHGSKKKCMVCFPQEEGYREVLEVEKRSGGLEMKIARISNEVICQNTNSATPSV